MSRSVHNSSPRPLIDRQMARQQHSKTKCYARESASWGLPHKTHATTRVANYLEVPMARTWRRRRARLTFYLSMTMS